MAARSRALVSSPQSLRPPRGLARHGSARPPGGRSRERKEEGGICKGGCPPSTARSWGKRGSKGKKGAQGGEAWRCPWGGRGAERGDSRPQVGSTGVLRAPHPKPSVKCDPTKPGSAWGLTARGNAQPGCISARGLSPHGAVCAQSTAQPQLDFMGWWPHGDEGTFVGPHCKPVSGEGSDPVPVPAPSAQSPGHRRMAQQGHRERETELEDIRVMNPILEQL